MGIGDKVKKAYSETRKILRRTRKPKKTEYTNTLKITGIGILAIGFLGFIIYMISRLTWAG